MTLYPTRSRLSRDAYRDLIVGGDSWRLMQDIMSGKRIVIFLPGSIKFGIVGFLGVLPISSIIIFLMLAFFKNESPAFAGVFIVGVGVVLTFTHGCMMLLVGLGLVYAQQDLVRFFAVLVLITFLCLMCGIYFGVPLGLTIYSFLGWGVSCVLMVLAKSASFSLYSDLMRIKRIFYEN